MIHRAASTSTRQGAHLINTEFGKRLRRFAGDGPSLTCANDVDNTRPPLEFQFKSENLYGPGVDPPDLSSIIGCGSTGGPLRCRPDMGQGIGCQYTRVCECLEYAAVDEKRLKEDELERYQRNELAGLPRQFPYWSPLVKDPRKAGCLRNFYLESRHMIYECNDNCECHEVCKSRVVRNGRKVPLEIFKTTNRGWGLRCPVDLEEGQFIDTYRGEVITQEEANVRDIPGKASYLFNLDKFVEIGDIQPEDCFVVDGELQGGPTRFINHSCNLNCRIFSVSYNKNDPRLYNLAFFACKHIRAGKELTFDYLDLDDLDPQEREEREEEIETVPCLCGSKKCRGRLWR